MKKVLICVLLCFMLQACSTKKSNCTLLVNDEVIENDFVEIDYESENANLPLITIIEALGGETRWISDNNVIIEIYGDEYVLNPEECTLTENGGEGNLITDVLFGGGYSGRREIYHKVVGKEFIIDRDSLLPFFDTIDVRVHINTSDSTVKVFKAK